ncbi:hypothetical protein SteCoe_36424 [Stentor coeruleus]|uniref:Uncharacterized protein n=1 Tax=Stentor coeruleus TaxID=5963 RepID=A0A1R2AQE2_9CILI|nr:hypothetical protein SteCoe_36424 [Stentor coeruleus]
MIDEHIFTTEVIIPDAFESMLDVSIQHKKLQEVMKFVMNILQRHEDGLKTFFTQFKSVPSEMEHMKSAKAELGKEVDEVKETVSSHDEMISELKEKVNIKSDIGETLKYLLQMITVHDSSLQLNSKLIEELKSDKEDFKSKTAALEAISKDLNGKIDLINAALIKIQKHEAESKQKIININSRAVENTESDTKKTQYLLSEKFIPKIERNDQKKNLEIKLINQTESPSETKKSEKPLTDLLSEDRKLKNEEKKTKPTIKSNFFEGIFPFPNKSFTETEKFFQTPTESSIKSPTVPNQFKSFESRLDIIEKILGSSETSNFHRRIEYFEKTIQYFEGIIEKIQPEVRLNQMNIKKIHKKTQDLEKEVIKKLNAEHFDSIKGLVFAMASGATKKELPAVQNVSTIEMNYVDNFSKRIEKLEGLYIENKISGINFEEINFKMKKIEQKMDFKIDTIELEKIKQSIKTMSEQQRNASLESDKDKKNYFSALKPSDSSLIASMNRRFLTFEDTVKSLHLPYGITLNTMWDEIQKLWDNFKYTLASLEAFTAQLDSKLIEATERQSQIIIERLFKAHESDVRNQIKTFAENSDKKYADKFEMLRGFKYVESMFNRIEAVLNKVEGEDAMLARKPLGGWSCGSCEKNLDKLNAKAALHTPWNRLPVRDPKERISKAGAAFSKMLCTIPLEPLKKKSLGEEDYSLPPVIKTERSITPQPKF